MAKTRDYMDYLDEKIGIAPANSQEEYQASKVIADLMEQHGIETSVQEFESQGSGAMVRNILCAVMFVALVVGGLVPDMLHVILLLVAAACAGVLTFIYYVRNPFEGLGPSQRSQNVIGIRRAQVPAQRGSRPVVIVAHYDTPRESMLRQGSLARYHTMVVRVAAFCPVVVAVTLLFQLLLFLPEPFRMFMWIVGILASLPALFVAVTTLASRAANCTVGANDNKSSVAALLSMVDKVSPADDAATGMAQEVDMRRQMRNAPQDESAFEEDRPQRFDVAQEVVGVRHGEEVLRSLNILPPSCEITYEEPRARIIESDYEQNAVAFDETVADSSGYETEESYGAAEEERQHDRYEDDWQDDRVESTREADDAQMPEEVQEEPETAEAREQKEADDQIPPRRTLPPIGLEDKREDEDDDGGEVEDDDDGANRDYYEEDDGYEEEYEGEYEDLDYDEYDDEYDDYEEEDDEEDQPIGSSIGSWFSSRFSAIRDRFAPGKEDEEEWIDEEDLDEESEDESRVLRRRLLRR